MNADSRIAETGLQFGNYSVKIYNRTQNKRRFLGKMRRYCVLTLFRKYPVFILIGNLTGGLFT